MIVEITSWIPLLTLRYPAIAPQTDDIAVAINIINQICNGLETLNDAPIAAASNALNKY